MAEKVDAMQIILQDLKDIKETQKEMRAELTVKFSTIHKRVDDLVGERYQCEIRCKERDTALQKEIWKTSGIMAGIIAFIFELGKFIISKIIK
jgi:hypothetical protein